MVLDETLNPAVFDVYLASEYLVWLSQTQHGAHHHHPHRPCLLHAATSRHARATGRLPAGMMVLMVAVVGVVQGGGACGVMVGMVVVAAA